MSEGFELEDIKRFLARFKINGIGIVKFNKFKKKAGRSGTNNN